jgi:antitoxin (DNA-binding transcriptional repressor) of toxin-antitoxin stability system
MTLTVGVREFRQDLAKYIDGDDPVTITRHERQVGVFIPTRSAKRDRSEVIAAYKAATDKLQAEMAALGLDEDEIVAEFDRRRKAYYAAQRAAGIDPTVVQ